MPSPSAPPTSPTTGPATLTPQQIQAFNGVTGWNTPASNPTSQPAQSRAAQILALGKENASDGDTSNPAEPGLLDRIGTDFNNRVNSAADAQESAVEGKESPTEATVHTIGQGAGMVGDVVGETTKSALDTMEDILPSPASGDTNVPGANLPNPLEDPHVQSAIQTIKSLAAAHPVVSDYLRSIGNIASILPVGDVIKAGAKLGFGGLEAAGKGAAETAVDAVDATKNVVNKTQLAATKGNQIPTLENAAQKGIPIPGDTQITDPLARYDQHVASEQTALKDAKADTALGKVGSNIGDAFKKVVAQRKEAGQTMASELEKIGDKSTDATNAANRFKNELTKNGLAVNEEDGSLMSSKTSKITDQDKDLLEDYNKRLTDLGPKPSIAELDAFLSKVPGEINVYKAKNAITGTTNGERIIKDNLTQLRQQFDPVKTGNGYLKDYAAARSKYADLSGFIKEGVGHLGKITQSGDFAKDASLAKSSVQSILNNGKKDWLIKLEQHTGYPAIDDATLASQAMKDTGDYRGNSLLELLSADKSGIPEVPTSLGKVAGHLLNFGKKKFAGTPIEQTRRFLQSLKK